jgi:vacuolar-type H+-ATPase subunit E/Vma4
MVARARNAGESDSKGEVAQTLVAARREAHARELAAQREVYEEFCRAALAASFELRGTPRYEALVKRLAEAARRQLGEGARLEIDPPTQGGVVGQAGSRRVDYTLAALTAGCISDLGERVGRLWE